MAITVEEYYNRPKNIAKAHCPTCYKTLKTDEADNDGMDEVEQEAIDFLMLVAVRHSQRHPSHKPIILIHHRLPTNQEIRNGD